MNSPINRQPRRWRIQWAAALTLALVLALALTVVANALTAGNVDGVWGNPTPSSTYLFRWCYAPDNTSGPAGAPTACSTTNAGIQSPPGSTILDENQIRYGSPASGSGDANRSGYGFNGNDNVGVIAANTPFFLGRFTHYNRPITVDNTANVLTGIDLTVALDNLLCDDGSAPVQGSTQTFVYDFTHDETPNDPANNPGGQCPHGDSTGNGCDDRVTVTSIPDQTFNCIDDSVTITYTVQILGFFTNPDCHLSATGTATTAFVTGEGQDNPACLWASISDPEFPFAITLGAFEAGWVDDHVLVTWETISEIDNLGFNLYRSDVEGQLGELITAQMIPSQAPGSIQGFFYSFEDFDVTPGQIYWYTLEDIDVSGLTTQHGPVVAVPQTPTAVTLSGLSAGAAPAVSGLPVVAVAASALAGLAAGLHRRNRSRHG